MSEGEGYKKKEEKKRGIHWGIKGIEKKVGYRERL